MKKRTICYVLFCGFGLGVGSALVLQRKRNGLPILGGRKIDLSEIRLALAEMLSTSDVREFTRKVWDELKQ